MGDFNLSLNEDQEQIKSWIHDFAVDVIRPAAEEWDEREEFPWPVVQEAAKIGLYGMDFMANGIADPTGLTLPVAIEEMFWGDAGIGLSIFGSGLAAVYDQAKDEWVLNGTKAWITNGGIADVHVVVAVVEPGIGSRGHASFVVPPGTPGLSMGQKYKKHGIRASHTSEVVLDDVRIPGSCLLGSKERLDAKIARAKARSSRRWQPSRRPARPWAPWPSASPAPPTSTRWSTQRSARRSASRSS